MNIENTLQWDETLLKMARPDIYRVNAFRILNIPVGISIKKIHELVRKQDLVAKYGNNENYHNDVLSSSIVFDDNKRLESIQRLSDPELMFIDEFFWFWPLSLDSAQTDKALLLIEQQKLKEAWNVWRDREAQGSMANVSVHNLAVLNHAMALDLEYNGNRKSRQQAENKQGYWKYAFSRWKKLLEDDLFWKRVEERIRAFNDPRLTNKTALKIREGLPKALLLINALLATQAADRNDTDEVNFHLTLIKSSGFGGTIVSDVLHHALLQVQNTINTICENARIDTAENEQNGNRIANTLINNSTSKLRQIDTLLAKGDFLRESVHDEIASQIRASIISYANKTQNWREVQELAQKSYDIAESSSLKTKIKEDIDTITTNIQYGLCWFCGNDADAESTAITIMHGNVEKEGDQVRWQRFPVFVPRCRRCMSAHKQKRTIQRWGVIFAWILAIVLGIAASSFWVGLITLGVIAASTYGLAAISFPKGIKQEKDVVNFPGVKERILQGWKIGEKPEGVQ